MRFQKIFRFNLGSRILAIKVNAWNQELHTHYGITNEVRWNKDTNFYVPFWDFKENSLVNEVIGGLKHIQQDFKLGDIYVIQTSPNQSYRAFGFDLLNWRWYIHILSGTDSIDLSYLKHTVMRGRAVIRVTEKDGTKNRIFDRLTGYNKINVSHHHQAFFSAIYPQVSPPRVIPSPIEVRVSKYESFR